MLYVLIFTVWPHDIPESYVLDHALTGSDCITALESYIGLNEIGNLTCEIDNAG